MLLQEGPAETLNYMIFGYVVILGTMGLFVLSLIVRARNLKRELKSLQDIESKK